MLAAAIAIAFASTPNSWPERNVWYGCLEAYSQVAMFTAESTVTIALEAMTTCLDERKAFQMRVFRDPETSRVLIGPQLSERLAEEDRAVARHTIAFLQANGVVEAR